MTINKNIDPVVYKFLTNENVEQVNKYIDEPMTATIIPKTGNSVNRDTVTAELIYYWMIALNIPFECDKWHLNRLLTLVNVCNIKSQPPKKMSKAELLSRNAAINAERRKALHTNG